MMFGSDPFAGTITERPTGITSGGGVVVAPEPRVESAREAARRVVAHHEPDVEAEPPRAQPPGAPRARRLRPRTTRSTGRRSRPSSAEELCTAGLPSGRCARPSLVLGAALALVAAGCSGGRCAPRSRRRSRRHPPQDSSASATSPPESRLRRRIVALQERTRRSRRCARRRADRVRLPADARRRLPKGRLARGAQPGARERQVGWVRAAQLRLLQAAHRRSRSTSRSATLTVRDRGGVVRADQRRDRRPGHADATGRLLRHRQAARLRLRLLLRLLHPRALGPAAEPAQGWSGGDRLAIHGSPTPTWGEAVSNGCLHAARPTCAT